MKRIGLCLTAFVILVTLLVPSEGIYAEQTRLKFTSEKTRYSIETDSISVAIHIENAEDVFGYSLNVSYPVRQLEFLECVEGDFFVNQGKETSFQRKVFESGTISIGSAILGKSEGVGGDGTLFTLTFTPLLPGTVRFSLSNIVLMDSKLTQKNCDGETFEITIFEEKHEPILAVDPIEVDFGSIEFGLEPKKTIRIYNSGEAELSGTVHSLVPWITINPKKFTGEGMIEITVDTTLLNPNEEHKGNIGIQSNGGSLEVPIIIYVNKEIDEMAPFLNILTPDDGFRTNNENIFFLCETEPGAYASINKQNIAVDREDGVFYYRTFLEEGKNTFTVSVWDVNRNTQSKTIHIELDTTPPSLQIDPVPIQTQKDSIVVTGKTDPTADLTFNGAEVLVKKDGTFKVQYNIIQKINQLIFTATDDLGNEVTKYAVFFYKPALENLIILTIGETIGVFNDQEFPMDAPPEIINGRVFVPIHVITDIYGADMEWNSETKEVHISLVGTHVFLKIGDVNARIEKDTTGTEKIVLESAPYISNGRTMVPLRFISEAFGSVVEYVSDTKQIMIKF